MDKNKDLVTEPEIAIDIKSSNEVKQPQMVFRKSIKEFRDTGLLWFINTILHMFGWAIAITIDTETREITEIYPARVRFRGFDPDSNDQGYNNVTFYLKNNIDELLKEAREEY